MDRPVSRLPHACLPTAFPMTTTTTGLPRRHVPAALATLLAALVTLLAAPLALPAAAADIPVTLYADAGYPPYSYEKDGKAAGLYFEIVKAAVARMHGYAVQIQPVPWRRGMALIRGGTGFALYPPYMNVRDEPWTWPYSLPLFEERVVVVCRKEVLAARPRRKWPDDFQGLVIGNNAGFIVGGEAFDAAVRDRKIVMEEARDSVTNILKLGMRRIDCYVNDRTSIQWTKNQLKAQGKYDEGGQHAELVEAAVVATEQGFLGFTDRDNGKFAFKNDFVRQFDNAIYQMKRTGDIDAIARNFFRSHALDR